MCVSPKGVCVFVFAHIGKDTTGAVTSCQWRINALNPSNALRVICICMHGSKHVHTHMHTHTLFYSWCVLFVLLYLSSCYEAYHLGFLQCWRPRGWKQKTNTVWCVQFFYCQTQKKEPLKNPESKMQNVIASSIVFKRSLSPQCFLLLCVIHGELLGSLSLTQLQWGIIGREIELWDTELCNRWDLSPFYNLLSFHNSYFQLLPLPSGREWGTRQMTELALALSSISCRKQLHRKQLKYWNVCLTGCGLNVDMYFFGICTCMFLCISTFVPVTATCLCSWTTSRIWLMTCTVSWGAAM